MTASKPLLAETQTPDSWLPCDMQLSYELLSNTSWPNCRRGGPLPGQHWLYSVASFPRSTINHQQPTRRANRSRFRQFSLDQGHTLSHTRRGGLSFKGNIETGNSLLYKNHLHHFHISSRRVHITHPIYRDKLSRSYTGNFFVS